MFEYVSFVFVYLSCLLPHSRADSIKIWGKWSGEVAEHSGGDVDRDCGHVGFVGNGTASL